MRGIWMLIAALCGVLGGCASTESNPRYAFRAYKGDEPLPHALVRAMPLETNLVPLPVTGETLEQYKRLEDGVVGVTAEDGTVRLRLFPEVSYLVEVLPPFDSPLADEMPGRRSYVLKPPFERLERSRQVDDIELGYRLELESGGGG